MKNLAQRFRDPEAALLRYSNMNRWRISFADVYSDIVTRILDHCV
ncbi:hypothetical protein [Pectobacterium sp. CHL-2024]